MNNEIPWGFNNDLAATKEELSVMERIVKDYPEIQKKYPVVVLDHLNLKASLKYQQISDKTYERKQERNEKLVKKKNYDNMSVGIISDNSSSQNEFKDVTIKKDFAKKLIDQIAVRSSFAQAPTFYCKICKTDALFDCDCSDTENEIDGNTQLSSTRAQDSVLELPLRITEANELSVGG